MSYFGKVDILFFSNQENIFVYTKASIKYVKDINVETNVNETNIMVYVFSQNQADKPSIMFASIRQCSIHISSNTSTQVKAFELSR